MSIIVKKKKTHFIIVVWSFFNFSYFLGKPTPRLFQIHLFTIQTFLKYIVLYMKDHI